MMIDYLFGNLILPNIVKDNVDIELVYLLALITYVFFLVNWIVSTDWLGKLHLFSLATCIIGVFYLHYIDVTFLARYELAFVATWTLFLYYHFSAWNKNYKEVRKELSASMVTSSMRPFAGSVFRFFIVTPTSKNASNQWNPPEFKNLIHVLLIFGYSFLLILHITPFFTPLNCITYEGTSDVLPEGSSGVLAFIAKWWLLLTTSTERSSLLCCRYNYAMQDFATHQMNQNYCSGRVRVAFAGSWSTGKTYLLGGLLGKKYATAQSAPAPTTDQFVCIAAGSSYSDPIRNDDHERRKHCEVTQHVNNIVQSECGGKTMKHVLDVADTNTEFGEYVFFDMPGWQSEYSSDCTYRTYFHQLIDKVDYTYIVWDVDHGMIEDEFAEFFRTKARGINYEFIYNRYNEGSVDMSFLNQQYAKMTTGKEILSEMYVTKVHENNTKFATQFNEDILHLRSKVKSVSQTVYDNRKKIMKENLMQHRDKIRGISALRRYKICNRLIEEELNLYVKPKPYHWRWLEL